MKKFILILLLLTCNPQTENEKIITVDCDNYYILLVKNLNHLYIFYQNGYCEFPEENFQEEFSNLQITAYKCYEPYNGILTLTLYYNDKILIKNTAENGIRKTEIFYNM